MYVLLVSRSSARIFQVVSLEVVFGLKLGALLKMAALLTVLVYVVSGGMGTSILLVGSVWLLLRFVLRACSHV